MKHKLYFLLSLFLVAMTVTAQPFAEEIAAFKKQDSASFPQKHAILFVGSSSFTKWTDVSSYFPGYTIINRGFGGSTLPDVIRYTNDIIIPYEPKQVVIYCGENDLASSDTVSARMVIERFKTLFYMIRKALPGANVSFISLKPSPSRKALWPKMVEVNEQVKTFLRGQPKTSFIDVYHKMFMSDGSLDATVFIEDQLHMNAKGYAIWQKAIQPYLLKD